MLYIMLLKLLGTVAEDFKALQFDKVVKIIFLKFKYVIAKHLIEQSYT